MSDLIDLPDKPLVLKNETCAYCGKPFSEELKTTREHVISRKFVPKVNFENRFNLILQVCNACNNEKSSLEDDIGLISMLPDQFGRYAVEDVRLDEEVQRRSERSISRLTSRAVSQSTETLTLTSALGAATLRGTFSAPPQVEHIRLYRLAHFHFQAFFYMLTYSSENRRGGFTLGRFCPLVALHQNDWGALRARWFMDYTRNWPVTFHTTAAEGYFRALIRRHPEKPGMFSWAFEWNGSIRVMGFVTDDETIQAMSATVPEEPMHILSQTEKEVIRFREEVRLPKEQDDLFIPRPGADQS